MDQSSLKRSLLKFLENESAKIAAIKGPWGVGKTHYWNQFISTESKSFGFRGYSYASLFGASNIRDVQNQLFANLEIREGKGKFVELSKWVTKIAKEIEVPYLSNSGGVVEALESKILENSLICIDDLERKDPSITGSMILGYINQLTQTKRCKVVLIYSEDNLDDLMRPEIEKYREKVIDVEYSYDPSVDSNLKLVWQDGAPDYVSEVFKELSINNIRIMSRTQETIRYFEAQGLFSKLARLRNAFLLKCTKLSILRYKYGHVVTLEDAITTNYYGAIMSLDKKEQTDDEKLKNGIISKFKLTPSAYDEIIIDYLNNGFVDLFEYRPLVDEAEELARKENISASYRAIWMQFYGNFTVTEADFVKNLGEFIQLYHSDLNLSDIVAGINILEELGSNFDLSGTLETATTAAAARVHSSRDVRFALMHLPTHVQEMVISKLNEQLVARPIETLISSLASNRGWPDREVVELDTYSEEAFYKWLLECNAEELKDDVKLALAYIPHYEGGSSASEKLIRALRRLSGRSKLDQKRVELVLGKDDPVS